MSFAKTTSNVVAVQKGGKAAKAAKGKPPKAPAAAGEGKAKEAAAANGEQQPAAAAAGGGAAAVDVGKPNPKLFVENLPAATTAAMLEMLFQQFPGGACLLRRASCYDAGMCWAGPLASCQLGYRMQQAARPRFWQHHGRWAVASRQGEGSLEPENTGAALGGLPACLLPLQAARR